MISRIKGGRQEEVDGAWGPNKTQPTASPHLEVIAKNLDHLNWQGDHIKFSSQGRVVGSALLQGTLDTTQDIMNYNIPGNFGELDWCSANQYLRFDGTTGECQGPLWNATNDHLKWPGFFGGQPINKPWTVKDWEAHPTTRADTIGSDNFREITTLAGVEDCYLPDLAWCQILMQNALRRKRYDQLQSASTASWQDKNYNIELTDNLYMNRTSGLYNFGAFRPELNQTGLKFFCTKNYSPRIWLPWYDRYWCSKARVKIHFRMIREGAIEERYTETNPTAGTQNVGLYRKMIEHPNLVRVVATPFRAFPLVQYVNEAETMEIATRAGVNRVTKNYCGAGNANVFASDCPEVQPHGEDNGTSEYYVQLPVPWKWEHVWGREKQHADRNLYIPKTGMFHKEYSMAQVARGVEDDLTFTVVPTKFLGLQSFKDGTQKYEELAWSAVSDAQALLIHDVDTGGAVVGGDRIPALLWGAAYYCIKNASTSWHLSDTADVNFSANMMNWLWAKINDWIGLHVCLSTLEPMFLGEAIKFEYWISIDRNMHGYHTARENENPQLWRSGPITGNGGLGFGVNGIGSNYQPNDMIGQFFRQDMLVDYDEYSVFGH